MTTHFHGQVAFDILLGINPLKQPRLIETSAMGSGQVPDGWHLHDSVDTQTGPFSWAEVLALTRAGKVVSSFKIFHQVQTNGRWVPITQSPPLRKIFAEWEVLDSAAKAEDNAMSDPQQVLVGATSATVTAENPPLVEAMNQTVPTDQHPAYFWSFMAILVFGATLIWGQFMWVNNRGTQTGARFDDDNAVGASANALEQIATMLHLLTFVAFVWFSHKVALKICRSLS